MTVNRVGVDVTQFNREEGQKGRRKTQSLFEEGNLFMSADKKETAVYTLKSAKNTSCTLPSLKDLYMEVGDPTEYQFAIEAFGSFDYWLEILGGEQYGIHPKYIRQHILEWRNELEVKLRSEGIRNLRKHAATKPNAALFFADGQFSVTKNKRGAGRPTTAEVERELQLAAKAQKEAYEEASRLGF